MPPIFVGGFFGKFFLFNTGRESRDAELPNWVREREHSPATLSPWCHFTLLKSIGEGSQDSLTPDLLAVVENVTDVSAPAAGTNAVTVQFPVCIRQVPCCEEA